MAIAHDENPLDVEVILDEIHADRHFEPSNAQARALSEEILELRQKLLDADTAIRQLAVVNALLTGATGPSKSDPISAASIMADELGVAS